MFIQFTLIKFVPKPNSEKAGIRGAKKKPHKIQTDHYCDDEWEEAEEFYILFERYCVREGETESFEEFDNK